MGWMIVDSVPLLNLFRPQPDWPYTLEELKQLPSGSWGAELAQMLSARNLGLLPKYEKHDAFHVLLGYKTTVTGELRLQAFMLGNGSASFAGHVLFGLGILWFPELWSQLRKDFTRGQQSVRISKWNVPTLLNCDLMQLSSQLTVLTR